MQAALETNDQEHAAALQAKDAEHAAALEAALEANDQEHAAALQAKDPEHAAALRENYQAWARRHRSMRNSTLQAQANSLSSFMDSISYVLYTIMGSPEDYTTQTRLHRVSPPLVLTLMKVPSSSLSTSPPIHLPSVTF